MIVDTAYIFCGGGAYALPQLGVVQYLLEHSKFGADDIAIGTSFGAISSAVLVEKWEPSKIIQMCQEFNNISETIFNSANIWNLLGFVFRWGFKDLRNTLLPFFKSAPIPLQLVTCATDLNTMMPTFFTSDSVCDRLSAIAASASIPLAFTPQKIDNNYYVDGGIINNVPLDYALKLNPKNIVVVGGMPSQSLVIHQDINNIGSYFSAIIDGMISKLNAYHDRQSGESTAPVSKVISYQSNATNMFDFTNYSKDIREGYTQAKNLLEK